MAVVPRKAASSPDDRPDAFEAARLAMAGELNNEELCEILLVGRCRKRFIRRQSENARSDGNGIGEGLAHR